MLALGLIPAAAIGQDLTEGVPLVGQPVAALSEALEVAEGPGGFGFELGGPGSDASVALEVPVAEGVAEPIAQTCSVHREAVPTPDARECDLLDEALLEVVGGMELPGEDVELGHEFGLKILGEHVPLARESVLHGVAATAGLAGLRVGAGRPLGVA